MIQTHETIINAPLDIGPDRGCQPRGVRVSRRVDHHRRPGGAVTPDISPRAAILATTRP